MLRSNRNISVFRSSSNDFADDDYDYDYDYDYDDDDDYDDDYVYGQQRIFHWTNLHTIVLT